MQEQQTILLQFIPENAAVLKIFYWQQNGAQNVSVTESL